MDNVAVVVLDALRYDGFTRAFDWLPGRRFTSAFAPSHWTVPVHAALFTGRYPSEVGVHSRAPALDCPQPALAERLAAASYRTRAFTANPQLCRYDGWTRGFDEFVGYASLDASHPRSFDWGTCLDDSTAPGYRRFLGAVWQVLRADCDTVRSLWEGYGLVTRSPADGGAPAVRDRLRATDFGSREFCVLNLVDTHAPYHPPAPGDDPVDIVAADAFIDDSPDLAGVDVDGHGRNLLADPQPVDQLVEYHGPLPGHEDQFERRDAPLDALERRQSPLWGFVAADGSDAYETHADGFRTVGEFDGDPRMQLREFRADLAVRNVPTDDSTVSESARERVEEQEYA